FKRTDGDDSIAQKTPIGILPKLDGFDLEGLKITDAQMKELLSLDKNFLLDEVQEIRKYFSEFVGDSTPIEILKQIDQFNERINNFKSE
ncbi:Phosphoenolpyruvate carboxykinase [GTP], partial [Brachionus plicatilis]